MDTNHTTSQTLPSEVVGQHSHENPQEEKMKRKCNGCKNCKCMGNKLAREQLQKEQS
ncbi:MAG: hypothetical protein AAF518_28465 [Spirochaetota bacterium]